MNEPIACKSNLQIVRQGYKLRNAYVWKIGFTYKHADAHITFFFLIFVSVCVSMNERMLFRYG